MRSIKLIITLMLALSILLIGIVLTIHNTTPISIDLVWVTLPEASMSIWLIAALVTGLLLGMALTSTRIITLRARLLSVGRKLRLAERQLDTLQSEAQRGSE